MDKYLDRNKTCKNKIKIYTISRWNYFEFDVNTLTVEYNYFVIDNSVLAKGVREIKKVLSLVDMTYPGLTLLFTFILKKCQNLFESCIPALSLFFDSNIKTSLKESESNDIFFQNTFKFLINFFSDYNSPFFGMSTVEVLKKIVLSGEFYLKTETFEINKYQDCFVFQIFLKHSRMTPRKLSQKVSSLTQSVKLKKITSYFLQNKELLFYKTDEVVLFMSKYDQNKQPFRLLGNDFDPQSEEQSNKLKLESLIKSKLVKGDFLFQSVLRNLESIVLSNSNRMEGLLISQTFAEIKFSQELALDCINTSEHIPFEVLNSIMQRIKQALSHNQGIQSDDQVLSENCKSPCKDLRDRAESFRILKSMSTTVGIFKQLSNGTLIGEFNDGVHVWVHPDKTSFKVIISEFFLTQRLFFVMECRLSFQFKNNQTFVNI